MSAVGYQSESQLLVDACLARLRIDAQLDDEPVLPTIDLLPEIEVLPEIELELEEDDDDFMEVDEAELVIECSARALPSAASIVREAVKANQSQKSQKEVPTMRRVKVTPLENVARRPSRWPVIVCALVATYFGTTAFIRSPLGAKPEVQHVVKVSRGHIANALHATKSLVRF